MLTAVASLPLDLREDVATLDPQAATEAVWLVQQQQLLLDERAGGQVDAGLHLSADEGFRPGQRPMWNVQARQQIMSKFVDELQGGNDEGRDADRDERGGEAGGARQVLEQREQQGQEHRLVARLLRNYCSELLLSAGSTVEEDMQLLLKLQREAARKQNGGTQEPQQVAMQKQEVQQQMRHQKQQQQQHEEQEKLLVCELQEELWAGFLALAAGPSSKMQLKETPETQKNEYFHPDVDDDAQAAAAAHIDRQDALIQEIKQHQQQHRDMQQQQQQGEREGARRVGGAVDGEGQQQKSLARVQAAVAARVEVKKLLQTFMAVCDKLL
jgi:hypothetical protein